MTIMGIKKYKYFIVIISFVLLFVACYFTYREYYLNSYCEIELEQILRFTDPKVVNYHDTPYWNSLDTRPLISKIERFYNISFGDINEETHMIIICYGAELKSMDYSTLEATFKTRGHYIGFPIYGEFEPNTAYVYKCPKIPIFDSEIGCMHYNYRGKFRDSY